MFFLFKIIIKLKFLFKNQLSVLHLDLTKCFIVDNYLTDINFPNP